MVNKPVGYLCTNSDPGGRPRAVDLLPHVEQRVYTVGRLDEASEGLLLMTNDGDLAMPLMHPRYGVPKTYLVLVAGKPTADDLQKLLEGVWLSEGKVKARSVKRLKSQGNSTWLRIVLTEGKNREIRRMLAKLGHKVMRLRRVAIGPVKLDKLPKGKARRASDRRGRGTAQVRRRREREDRQGPPANGRQATGRTAGLNPMVSQIIPLTGRLTPAGHQAMFHRTARVTEHVPLAERTFRVRLECPDIAAAIRPGQFVMLRLPNTTDPLLGRPFALYDTVLDRRWPADRLRRGLSRRRQDDRPARGGRGWRIAAGLGAAGPAVPRCRLATGRDAGRWRHRPDAVPGLRPRTAGHPRLWR